MHLLLSQTELQIRHIHGDRDGGFARNRTLVHCARLADPRSEARSRADVFQQRVMLGQARHVASPEPVLVNGISEARGHATLESE